MKYLFIFAALLFATPAYALETSASASATVCTMEYAPVCGVKKVSCTKPDMTYGLGEQTSTCAKYTTYGNRCMMQADNAQLSHAGECSAKELGETSDEKPEPPKANPPQAYTPPTGCIAWFDGCNSCGNGACTMRACFAYQPGYCTKWSSDPIPTEPNGGIGNTPDVPKADGEVEIDGGISPNDTDASFFARIWLNILSWF